MPVLLTPKVLSMAEDAAERLVATGDGDCALLYIALMREGEPEKAQAVLHWGQGRMDSTLGRLKDLGLVGEDAAAPRTAQKPELPRYSRQDVVDTMEREPEFLLLQREVEQKLGRPLSDSDLTCLLTMYDALALPAEVILVLTAYVAAVLRRQKQNPGYSPRLPEIQREAFRWKRLGITSGEAAERFLTRQQQVDAREWEILSAVGVRDRRPAVEKERDYISSWVDMAIPDELIALAYERTVFKKGEMNWPYMNKILLSWNQSGWHSAAEVKANDRPAKRGAAKKTEDYQPSAQRIQKSADWLDQLLEEETKGG